jgi:hypothetical protein
MRIGWAFPSIAPMIAATSRRRRSGVDCAGRAVDSAASIVASCCKSTEPFSGIAPM